MVSIIIYIYIMTLQQQEHSIGSDLEKTTLSIIHTYNASPSMF